MRYLDAPLARLAIPVPPSPPTPRPRRAPRVRRRLLLPCPSICSTRPRAGRLGIVTEDLDTQLAEYFGVKEGVLVKSVTDDSVAAKAGLKAGDVITSINGRKVYDTSDITRALDRTESDGQLTIEVTRDKKPQTLKGKLEARDNRTRGADDRLTDGFGLRSDRGRTHERRELRPRGWRRRPAARAAVHRRFSIRPP
jgi:membrane-associated protease RseP (regulator of RpoE activity)